VVIQREDVEIISSHGQAGKVHAGNRKVRILAKIFGQERLLDVAGDADSCSRRCRSRSRSTSRALSRILAAVGRQRVQDLPVQFGKRGGTL